MDSLQWLDKRPQAKTLILDQNRDPLLPPNDPLDPNRIKVIPPTQISIFEPQKNPNSILMNIRNINPSNKLKY